MISSEPARRLGRLASSTIRDTARVVGRASPAGPPEQGAMRDAARWLARTHEVTGRRGSSRGYSLVSGWAAAFPETTGYVIGTLLAYGRITEEPEWERRAREMGDWEIELQAADGGVIQGLVGPSPGPTIAFNTGMVLHGYVDLAEATAEPRYLEAGRRAGDFLVATQDADGAWRGAHAYLGLPHTYKSRIAWAMLRLAEATGESSYRSAAERHLAWVLEQQDEDGWFANCNFEPNQLPNTHGIAYTLRGLLESHALTGERAYLEAVTRTSDRLIAELGRSPRLPASFGPGWRPAARYECLTGTVQLGNVWIRLGELTGEPRYTEAGVRAVDRAAAHQDRSGNPDVRGALPGSFPIYGRYSPLRYPNWATKFLLDALMRRRQATGLPRP